jgi:hypothetical protein
MAYSQVNKKLMFALLVFFLKPSFPKINLDEFTYSIENPKY